MPKPSPRTITRYSDESKRTVVRRANLKDADAAMQVVRRSIEELCAADHRNDAVTLTRWLANKTPEYFRSWIANPDNFCVVAEVEGRLSGVGLVDRAGEIKLFYLLPGMQRQGIGTAIHLALEKQARAWRLSKLHLDSTANAKSFYVAMGYKPADAAGRCFGMVQCYPYEKILG